MSSRQPGRLVGILLLLGGGAGAAQALPGAEPRAEHELCPVDPGLPGDPEFTLVIDGRAVVFCSGRCRGLFVANPAPYLALLEALAAPPAEASFEEPAAAPAETTVAMQTDPGPEPEAVATPAPVPLVNATPQPVPEEPFSEETESTEPDPDPSPVAPLAPSRLDELLERIGRFHVALVHFPLGLLLGALLAEFGYAARGSAGARAAARWCLGAGAAASALAVPLGWIRATSFEAGPAVAETLWLHRWVGTVTAFFAVVVWLLARRADASRQAAEGRLYRAAILLLAVLVVLTGHYGGTLVFGLDYLLGPGRP